MAVTKRTRFEVLRRDGHRCTYCGAGPEDAKLTVDHVIPVALGGSDDPSNLTTACGPCNSGKASVPADAPLVAAVDERAMWWRAAMEVAADEIRGAQVVLNLDIDNVDKAWSRWTTAGYGPNDRHPLPRPDTWRGSVKTWLEAGLTADDIIDMIDVAMRANVSDPWRYFCGCCWRLIRQQQDRALEILDERFPRSSASAQGGE